MSWVRVFYDKRDVQVSCIALLLINVYRSNNFHVYKYILNLELGVIGGLITPVRLPVYQVRLDWLPLPCIALIQPNH